jgi:hypothetical protein
VSNRLDECGDGPQLVGIAKADVKDALARPYACLLK